MTEDDQKKSYPLIPTRAWWALRERFKRTMPAKVTGNYLASALNMTAKSANSNVMPSLRTMGLIDDDGKPTKLAVKWRDDAQYPEACKTIIAEVYPEELRDLAPDTTAERGAIEQWFQNTTHVGAVAARKMATVFFMLLDADPIKGTTTEAGGTRKPATRTTKRKAKRTKKTAKTREDKNEGEGGGAAFTPKLNLNIQIHLSSEATPEQIDQIFESMARHLKSE